MIPNFFDLLSENPIIASIKDEKGLANVVKSDNKVVFVLHGSICNIQKTVDALKQAEKTVFVHIDLIDGLSGREVAVEYLRSTTALDGIISTKASLIKIAKGLGLLTVHRFFLLDSMSLENIPRQISLCAPDSIEVLPACMPKIITKLSQSISSPIIAGGLIQDKSDVMAALSAGACAVSTTKSTLWEL